jgi:hypothetical protein
MEQSTSWEANSHSARQEIPRRFITVFTGSSPESDVSNPQIPNLFP